MSEERKVCCAGRGTWALIASVALNLFLIGVFAAPMFGPGFMGPRPPRPMMEPGLVFEHVAREMPPDEAKKLHAIVDPQREVVRKQHEVAREAMHKMAEIMKADKPDREALHQALGELQGFGQAMHDGMTNTIERMATELSPESRRLIADKFEKPFPPMPDRMGFRLPRMDEGPAGRGLEPMPDEDGMMPPPPADGQPALRQPALRQPAPGQPAPDAPAAK